MGMKLNNNEETHTLVFPFELEKDKSYALIVICNWRLKKDFIFI